jgi:hypothetical protein
MSIRKLTSLLSLTALLAILSLPALAADITNSPPEAAAATNAAATDLFGGPITNVWNFLAQGSNFMIAPYGIVSTDGKTGGGLAIAYKLSDFVVPTMRLDYYDHEVWMPSASLQLQAPLTLAGKLTVIPFAFSGIATAVAGRGAENGTVVGIFGAGGAVRLSTTVDLVADYEHWTGFKGDQIRFGVLFKF